MRDIAIPLPIARTVLNPVFRITLHHRLPRPILRKLVDVVALGQALPTGTHLERLRLGGRPAARITVGANGAERPGDTGVVLYLHGGGYTFGSITSHRSLAAHLARATGYPVYLPEYRLAPEHPCPAAVDDAEAAFLELVALGHPPNRIAIAGDSAGGGLSLALAQRLRDRHGIRPAALGLIAPAVNPKAIPDRPRDLVLSNPLMHACAAAYLGDGDDRTPGYAPLFGGLDGLPPTYVQVDVSEMLYEQCVALVAGLRESGVDVRFTESHGLWHVAQLQAALVTEAAAAVVELADFLREAVEPVSTREDGDPAH
ncbi:alpha/beta hydrolase [Nocardia sp. NPDC052566]|uniref:alpha/beta hydrolase n=1 Tax=Nocardia sp. NPDC052566 TaxID=3364330 RepID=UPI0037C75F22